MTPERLRRCIEALHWTQRGLARVLERQEGTVRQWARGVVQIPDEVAAWLDRLARFHERHPPPAQRNQTNPTMTSQLKGRATYDPEADAIGIYFAPDGVKYYESEEIAPGLTLDFDAEGKVIGVEILGVRRFLAERTLARADFT